MPFCSITFLGAIPVLVSSLRSRYGGRAEPHPAHAVQPEVTSQLIALSSGAYFERRPHLRRHRCYTDVKRRPNIVMAGASLPLRGFWPLG